MSDKGKSGGDKPAGPDKAKGKGRAETGLKVKVKTARGRTASSVRWLQRQLNDPYVVKARKEGWRSRAAFKLIEIDEKYHLLKPGNRVVDLGAAPGGWCQVAAKKTGSTPGNPLVVGIDYLEMDGVPGVALLQKDFLDEDAPEALMAALGHPGQHPEGRFLPETYAYQRGDSDLAILRRAHAAMAQALDEAWQGRADDVPLATPDEALVLASIVEKETGQAHERPQIAGVFARRLRKGMLLQTDPTVIYGLGSGYDGNIRKRDLTTDTPYNTYTRVGLPPTPIAMPGRAALQAAVNPAPGDALFFVSRNDGSHVFSATYAEHNRAVDCYQRRRGCPPGQQALPAPDSPARQGAQQGPAQGPQPDPGPR